MSEEITTEAAGDGPRAVVPIVIPPARPAIYRCPKCETESEGDKWTLFISGEELPEAGRYCLKCYLRFLANSVPRLQEVDAK